MQFVHQISQKLYFRPKTSFYPGRGDIEPNEPWRAHVPMGLYQTPVSNPESIFFTCPAPGRFSQKPCLNIFWLAIFLIVELFLSSGVAHNDYAEEQWKAAGDYLRKHMNHDLSP